MSASSTWPKRMTFLDRRDLFFGQGYAWRHLINKDDLPRQRRTTLGSSRCENSFCRGRPFQTAENLARVYEAELPLRESPPNLARSDLLCANVTYQFSGSQNQQITPWSWQYSWWGKKGYLNGESEKSLHIETKIRLCV